MTRRPSPADGGWGWPWSRETGCGSGAAGRVCGWPRPRVPGRGQAGQTRREEPGEEAGAGAGVRVGDLVCEVIECWTGGGPVRPGLRAPVALGSPGRGAGGCGRPVGWAERGLEGAGALCAEQA